MCSWIRSSTASETTSWLTPRLMSRLIWFTWYFIRPSSSIDAPVRERQKILFQSQCTWFPFRQSRTWRKKWKGLYFLYTPWSWWCVGSDNPDHLSQRACVWQSPLHFWSNAHWLNLGQFHPTPRCYSNTTMVKAWSTTWAKAIPGVTGLLQMSIRLNLALASFASFRWSILVH